MPIRGYSVGIAVADRKKAARWYTQKLGFRVFDHGGHWTTVGDRSGGLRLHLCESERPAVRLKRSEVGNTAILYTTTEPILKAYARLRRKGVRFSEPPHELPWGWVGKFLDPDGNEFWLCPAW